MRKTANCNEENKAPYLEHSFPGEVVHTFNHSIQHAEGGSKDSLAYRGSSSLAKATHIKTLSQKPELGVCAWRLKFAE